MLWEKKENNSLGLPSSENLDLATAVYMLTFYEYIKENWFEAMPYEMFHILEEKLGWHLCITCRK